MGWNLTRGCHFNSLHSIILNIGFLLHAYTGSSQRSDFMIGVGFTFLNADKHTSHNHISYSDCSWSILSGEGTGNWSGWLSGLKSSVGALSRYRYMYATCVKGRHWHSHVFCRFFILAVGTYLLYLFGPNWKDTRLSWAPFLFLHLKPSQV